jgi:hypothetical protein
MKRILLIIMLYLSTYTCSDAPNLSVRANNETHMKVKAEIEYGLEFECFLNHLGLKESNNNWKAINTNNYIGEWQFGYETLKILGYGYITPDKFRKDPNIFSRKLQKQVLRELIDLNIGELAPYKKYIDTTIKGVKITRAGLLAAMHLGGIVSVKNFLISHGATDPKDAYGTRTSDYIREFGIYKI